MNPSSAQILMVWGKASPADSCIRSGDYGAVPSIQFHVARSFAEAREKLSGTTFDAICTRLELPDSHGFETLERLRSATRSGVPILAMVPEGDDSRTRLEALAAGATECIPETDTPEGRLATVIHHILEKWRAEERLREREAFLWLLSENVTDMIAVIDRDGRRLYNNPSYARLVSNVGELRGTDSFVEIHPVDRERIQRVFRDTVRSGIGQRAEYRFVTVAGEIRYVESQGSVIRDPEGQTSKVVVISRDITERKLAEQALRESEQRYKRLLESTTDYLFTVAVQNGQATGTTHGQGCVALTGYSPESFSADPYLWYRMIHPADRPAVEAQVASILRGEFPPTLEHRIVRKDGRQAWIRNTVVPHFDDHGRLVSYDGVVSDITARKEAEQATAESQERLDLVMRGSSDGIWDWNVATNEVYFSPRWKSMLGYGEDEIENKFSEWERLVHPEDREQALSTIRGYFEGRLPTYELEHRLRHKDGTYRYILARGIAQRDAQGRPLRMAGSHVDLTERKLVEERLRQAKAGLELSEEALRKALAELMASHEELRATQLKLIQAARHEVIGTLASGVAHEVKNPLQTILMGLAYLDRPTGSPGNSQGLVITEMREAIQRADSIIRDLLQLSAPPRLIIRADDLNDLIRRSIRLMNHHLNQHRVLVETDLSDEVPPVPIDPGKIQQVFLNLFMNAIHAMAEGGFLRIRTRKTRWNPVEGTASGTDSPFEAGEEVVVAEVEDTGPGIPEAILPRIFDPFFTTKPVGVGTGLGLSVARRIIDLHHGLITIINRADGGVKASLWFKVTAKTPT